MTLSRRSAALLAVFAIINVQAQCALDTTFDLTSSSNVANMFTAEGGSLADVTFSGDGARMEISEQLSSIVLQSKMSFAPPVEITLVMEGSDAPGAVPCMAIWNGQENTNAIDLELLGGFPNLVMLELFRGTTQDRGYNTDVTVSASAMEQPGWDWVFQPASYNSTQATTYVVTWTEDYINWQINGAQIVRYSKTAKPWIVDALPIRLGLWATDPGTKWAGATDWSRTPTMTSTFKYLSVSCPSDTTSDSTDNSTASQASSTSASALTSSVTESSATTEIPPNTAQAVVSESPAASTSGTSSLFSSLTSFDHLFFTISILTLLYI